MNKNTCISVIFLGSIFASGCNQGIKGDFKNPPSEYKPMPFWHINGKLTRGGGICKQMKDAHDVGFTGASLLPLASKGNRLGTSPKFLSDAYFDRFQGMLDVVQELDMEIILYEDNDFPSGMAGGKLGELFPAHTMKRLDKVEIRFYNSNHSCSHLHG